MKNIIINGIEVESHGIYVVNTAYNGLCLVEFPDNPITDYIPIIVSYYDDTVWQRDHLHYLDYNEKSFRQANREEIGIFIRKNPFYKNLSVAFSSMDFNKPDFHDIEVRRLFHYLMGNCWKKDVFDALSGMAVKK